MVVHQRVSATAEHIQFVRLVGRIGNTGIPFYRVAVSRSIQLFRTFSLNRVHQRIEQISAAGSVILLLILTQRSAVSHTDQVQAEDHQKSLMSGARGPEGIFGKGGKSSISISPPAHAVFTRQPRAGCSDSDGLLANELRTFPVTFSQHEPTHSRQSSGRVATAAPGCY